MANIGDILKGATESQNEHYSVICTVVSVDANKRVCTAKPKNGDAMLFNVRLQSKVNLTTGVVLIPEFDSDIIVSFLSKDLAAVTHTSDVKDILVAVKTIKTDSDSIEVSAESVKFDSSEIVINGGAKGGVPVGSDLVREYNAVISRLNEVITVLKGFVPVATDGGAALKVAAQGLQTLSTVNVADIENDKVKH